MKIKYYKPLKDLIRDTMRDYEKTRDSDKLLWIFVCKRLLQAKYGDEGLTWERLLYYLPPEASIKRIRAYIQNDEKMYPPTTEKVAKRRLWDNTKYKERIGENLLFPIIENKGVVNECS
jgi:hypothetical protein